MEKNGIKYRHLGRREKGEGGGKAGFCGEERGEKGSGAGCIIYRKRKGVTFFGRGRGPFLYGGGFGGDGWWRENGKKKGLRSLGEGKALFCIARVSVGMDGGGKRKGGGHVAEDTEKEPEEKAEQKGEGQRGQRELSWREMAFIQEMLVDGNQTAAAIRAGYSPKNASTQGARLMKKKAIKEAILTEQVKQAARLSVSRERVLSELARIGFYNVADVVDLETGKVLSHARRDDLAAISAVEVRPGRYGTQRKVVFHDKGKALKELAVILGMTKVGEGEAGDGPGVQIVDDIGQKEEDGWK